MHGTQSNIEKLLILVFGILVAFACPAATAVKVRSLEPSATTNQTQAVLGITTQTDYKVFVLDKPDRLVLDLKRGQLAESFKKPSAFGFVKNVRFGYPDAQHLRIVFDLKKPVKPKTVLQRAKDGYELVLQMRDPESGVKKATMHADRQETPAPPRDVIIAIDAGHGGQDPGAVGKKGTYEKNAVLAVAKRLAKAISKERGMQAVLIRDGDYFISLKKRYEKARDAKADLFVSIHADAIASGHATGSSVYMLSTKGASSEAARWLADSENASDLVGGVSLNDKESMLAKVLLDLSQGATLNASAQVATSVLQSLHDLGYVHKNEVQRANFVVLRSPDVPSILIETAFISNPNEEKKLNKASHQESLAQAIKTGIKDYFISSPLPGTWLAQQQPTKAREHIVARGETLGAIAQRHGVKVSTLRKANRLKTDMIQTGKVLRIPVST